MAKARAGFHGPYGLGINQFFKGIGGPEYIASLLAGYTGEEKEEAGTILYENTAFPGGWIAMAPPLYGDDVEFADGHSTDLEQIAEDVSAFLMWTAEPKMMARKQAGFVGGSVPDAAVGAAVPDQQAHLGAGQEEGEKGQGLTPFDPMRIAARPKGRVLRF